jgi:hypothetical protein
MQAEKQIHEFSIDRLDCGYKSPIEVFENELQTQMDNDIMEVVFSYGINVDKNELVKALAYDRKQYEAGFADGRAAAERRIAESLGMIQAAIGQLIDGV